MTKNTWLDDYWQKEGKDVSSLEDTHQTTMEKHDRPVIADSIWLAIRIYSFASLGVCAVAALFLVWLWG